MKHKKFPTPDRQRIGLPVAMLIMVLATGCTRSATGQNEKIKLRPFTDSMVMREVKFRLKEPGGINQNQLTKVETKQLLLELSMRMEIRGGKGQSGHADERTDIYEIKKYYPDIDQHLLDISGSIPALIPKRYLNKNADGSYSWDNLKSYYKAYEFCDAHVPFGLQPSCAIGTGFVVSDTQVATAGHCFEGNQPSDLLVVFGYQMENHDKYPKKMSPGNVYEIESVKFNKSDVTGLDIAIIKVKGKFPVSRKSMQFRNDPIGADEELYAYGYPQGIPLKFVSECRLMAGAKPAVNTFKIKGDLFEGNSGSPLVDSTGRIVGMVLGGGVDTDIFKVNDCAFIFNCDLHKKGACIGELIQQAATIRNSITN